MDQYAVYTSTPLNDWLLRYSQTVYTNMASEEEHKLLALLRNSKLKEIVGGTENEKAVVKSFDRFLAIQRGLHETQSDNEIEELFTETAKSVRHIGAVKALASISQFVKQSTVSVKTWINLLSTGDANLFVPAVHAVMSARGRKNHPVMKLLNSSTLVSRSLRLGGTDRGTAEAYKLQRTARRWFFRKAETSRVWLDKKVRRNLSFLITPDIFNARIGFLSYYMKSLRDQGVKIDLNTEFQNLDTPERKTAIAFAETMVEKTQTASNAALLSEFQAKAKSNWGEFVKTVFVPFSNFDADFKARLVNEFSAMRRTGSFKDGVQFAGSVGEALTFALVSGVVVNFWKEFIKKGIYAMTGADEPEEDPIKQEKRLRQRLVSSLIGSLNPLAIGTVSQEKQGQLLNQIGYLIDKQENPYLTKKEWLKDNAWTYEPREGTLLENLGVYSTGLSPLLEMASESPKLLSILGEPVTVVDAYGNEKTVRLTKEQILVLTLKLAAESSAIAGMTEADIANVIREIYREQMKMTTPVFPNTQPVNDSPKTFRRRPKTFKRND
jgi:hypothetical protein